MYRTCYRRCSAREAALRRSAQLRNNDARGVDDDTKDNPVIAVIRCRRDDVITYDDNTMVVYI